MDNEFVNAADATDGNAVGEAGTRLIGYCEAYGYVILVAAVLFLAAGLVFVTIAGRFEAAKARAEAAKAEAEAAKARAEAVKARLEAKKALRPGETDDARPQTQSALVVGPIVTAAKGLAETLGNAKAWVAMVVIGLVLLWMAASAPQACLTGSGDEREEDTSNNSSANRTTTTTTNRTTANKTTANTTTANTSGTAGENGQAAANQQSGSRNAPPPVPALQPGGAP